LELFAAVFVVADASGDTTPWAQNRLEIQIAHALLWVRRDRINRIVHHVPKDTVNERICP
jgi:hypothetical protein